MSNEKFYDHYQTDAETASKVRALFDKEVGNKRNDALAKLLKITGAVAWCEKSSAWGSDQTLVRGVVYPIEDFEIPKHVKMIRGCTFEGKHCVEVRGELNSNAGREFNKHIDACNDILRTAPKFTDWVVTHFDVMSTGLGGPCPNGRGVSMISTYGGRCGDVLVFAVAKGDRKVDVPECFEQITYGQFYDMTEGDK